MHRESIAMPKRQFNFKYKILNNRLIKSSKSRIKAGEALQILSKVEEETLIPWITQLI
jgi:hypothetical protein